jgi:hypothetical protein
MKDNYFLDTNIKLEIVNPFWRQNSGENPVPVI